MCCSGTGPTKVLVVQCTMHYNVQLYVVHVVTNLNLLLFFKTNYMCGRCQFPNTKFGVINYYEGFGSLRSPNPSLEQTL